MYTIKIYFTADKITTEIHTNFQQIYVIKSAKTSKTI